MKTLLILLVCVATGLSVLAAEAPSPNPEQPPAADKAADGKSADAKAQTPAAADIVVGQGPTQSPKQRKPGDIFQPSEAISEDFAVAFPVDI